MKVHFDFLFVTSKSIAMPLIGAGSGGYVSGRSKSIMIDELSKIELPLVVKVVVFDDK